MNPEQPLGQPPAQDRTKPNSMFGQVISQYNEYGNNLKGHFSMRELAEKLLQVAEFAETTLTTENGNDWYDAHTIKRNVKEIRGYVKEFSGIAEEYDSMKMRAEALYDDMGRVLERYFEVNGYDAGAGDEIQIANGDKSPDLMKRGGPNQPSGQGGMGGIGEESETGNVAPVSTPMATPAVDPRAKDKDLKQRLISIARHKMTGEQLSRFDVLPEEKQVRAAWMLVR